MKRFRTVVTLWRSRTSAALVLSSAALAVQPARAAEYPEGFDMRSGGARAAAVRVDSRGEAGSFEKIRAAMLQTWRVADESALAAGLPRPPRPVFEAGWDRPVQSHTARFIRLDQTADVRLTTMKGYGCNREKSSATAHVCGPTVNRYIVLYKLIGGRRHAWKANLDDGKGSQQIDAASAATRLSHLPEEDAVRMDLGTPDGFDQHLGYRCRVRVLGEHRVCNYVEQAGTPAALHHVVAWNQHVSDPKRYTRLSHVSTAESISASYFEPPQNIRFVDIHTGSALSSESQEDDEEQAPLRRKKGERR
jgi:hypothetical protein